MSKILRMDIQDHLIQKKKGGGTPTLPTPYNINNLIELNINMVDKEDIGLISANIIQQLRNLVEAVILYIYNTDIQHNVDLNNAIITYENITIALHEIKKYHKYNTLVKLHNYLLISVSHYTNDIKYSERLLIKYTPYLIEIRSIMQTYGFEILQKITLISEKNIGDSYEYYKSIANKINNIKNEPNQNNRERFYIIKTNYFIIDHKKFYELNITRAMDNQNKFNRIIVYTDKKIPQYYAVELTFIYKTILVNGFSVNIIIVEDYNISIRPCEIKNYGKIFGHDIEFNRSYKEYDIIMDYLKAKNITLLDIVLYDDLCKEFCNLVQENKLNSKILQILAYSHKYIGSSGKSANILRYLLVCLKNDIIKKQYDKKENRYLDNLYLSKFCSPFADKPFYMSLHEHTPIDYYLYSSIDVDERQHELLARHIRNMTETNGNIYHNIKNIKGQLSDDRIKELINKFNNSLIKKHDDENIIIDGNNIYRKGYINDLKCIVSKLDEYNQKESNSYQGLLNTWKNGGCNIDCKEKEQHIHNIFQNGSFACIIGPAGTGKTTFISYVSDIFTNNSILYLTNTHTALENLRTRIKINNKNFMTISKAIKQKKYNTTYDIIIIDECSTISNKDIRKILYKYSSEYILLVGDPYQISSISFGNWFNYIVEKFANIYRLSNLYRTQDDNLQHLWNLVRDNKPDIKEQLLKCGYSHELNLSDLVKVDEDEDQVILCLNYDGLYGINNLNNILQDNNNSKEIKIGTLVYKENDPILFTINDMSDKGLYNNLKGKIVKIVEKDYQNKTYVIFIILLRSKIEQDSDNRFKILYHNEEGTFIQIVISKSIDTDIDTEQSSIIPFQLAYAISIHKAQGLEYSSVKIVISDVVDEIITHDIFYTAITRSKKNLKIFWSKHTEEKILNQLKEGYNKDEFNKIEYMLKNNK